MRLLNEFKGNGVVIGCGNDYVCLKHLHYNKKDFYTIDRRPSIGPDFVFDIRHSLPKNFKSRFKLTLVEFIGYPAFNEVHAYYDSKVIQDTSGGRGFKNIMEMTAADGFVLLAGCPRIKEFRRELHVHQFNYIELDEKGEFVLIAKNQALSFNDVQNEIEKLPLTLKNTIVKAAISEGSRLQQTSDFCSLNYNKMVSLHCTTLDDYRKIIAFLKIYNALYEGESAWFKAKDDLVSRPFTLFFVRLQTSLSDKPKGRVAKAWSLAEEHTYNVSASNHALVEAIHAYSVRCSNPLIGFFKQEKTSVDKIKDNLNEQKDDLFEEKNGCIS